MRTACTTKYAKSSAPPPNSANVAGLVQPKLLPWLNPNSSATVAADAANRPI